MSTEFFYNMPVNQLIDNYKELVKELGKDSCHDPDCSVKDFIYSIDKDIKEFEKDFGSIY